MFDFHATLVDHRDSWAWIEAAGQLIGSLPVWHESLDPETRLALMDHLDQIWGHAQTIDPGSSRDLSQARHREVFLQAVSMFSGLEPGLADKLDGVVLSYEVGAVKPQPEIFARALDLLDIPAAEVLMVGDSWRDDAGAAALGIRTLILPRTNGPRHGLDLVLRLAGTPRSPCLPVDK